MLLSTLLFFLGSVYYVYLGIYNRKELMNKKIFWTINIYTDLKISAMTNYGELNRGHFEHFIQFCWRHNSHQSAENQLSYFRRSNWKFLVSIFFNTTPICFRSKLQSLSTSRKIQWRPLSTKINSIKIVEIIQTIFWWKMNWKFIIISFSNLLQKQE